MSFETVTIGPATLIRGDALTVIETLPDHAFDSCVMDPPYCSGSIGEAQRVRSNGQGLRSENLRRFGWFVGDNMGTAGLVWLLRSVAAECRRVIRPTGSLLAFCDWRMLSAIQPAVESVGLRFQNLIVWDKGSMGLGSGFRCRHELVLHFTFGSPEYFDRGTPNVIVCPRVDSDDRDHQAQKPVDLIRALIEVVTPLGGCVLDPFMGSATGAIACLRSGRSFVGVDADPDVFAVARRRVETAVADAKASLFPPPAPAPAARPGLFPDDGG